MLANLPIMRSAGVRLLFLGSALLTAVIAIWANDVPRGASAGLAPIFVYLFSILDYAGANCALLILVAAVFVPQRYSFRPLLSWIGRNPVLIALASCLVLCLGAVFVYCNHPLSMDEYCAYFQSQVFASGHLTGQFPPALLDWTVPPGFQNYFLFVSHTTGRIASAYWPSFALVLTPFTWLGIPWACNAVISALTLLVVHRLALRIFADVEVAGLAVLLTVASPVFFANGISYYSMPAHLLANAVYALLLIDPTPRRAAIAGLVGSVALTLHNPVPHMLFALPWILALAKRTGGAATIGSLFAGYLPLSLVLGFGWALFSSGLPHEGTAAMGAAAASDNFMRVGGAFGPPSEILLFARLIGMAKIWVWAVPGLVALAIVGAWKWRRDEHCRLLAASAGFTLLGFLFVPVDQGHGWGFRYFHSAWMVLPLFAAGALTATSTVVNSGAAQRKNQHGEILEDSPTRTFVVACALLTLIAGNGLRAVEIRDFVSRHLQQLPGYAGNERRVVIIDPASSFYGQDLTRNDPWLHGNVIRMITHGRAADANMMREQFPELHRVYFDRFGSVWSAAPARVAGASP